MHSISLLLVATPKVTTLDFTYSEVKQDFHPWILHPTPNFHSACWESSIWVSSSFWYTRFVKVAVYLDLPKVYPFHCCDLVSIAAGIQLQKWSLQS